MKSKFKKLAAMKIIKDCAADLGIAESNWLLMGISILVRFGWDASDVPRSREAVALRIIAHQPKFLPLMEVAETRDRKLKERKKARLLRKRAERKASGVRSQVRSRPIQDERVDQARIDEFYSSWEWSRVRYDFVKGKNRLCQCCGASPTDGVRIVVDHIKPIRHHWARRLDPANLQLLCDPCNMGKGSRDETDWRRQSVR